MPSGEKKRATALQDAVGHKTLIDTFTGAVLSDESVPFKRMENQHTFSSGTAFNSKKKNKPLDCGGSFLTHKTQAFPAKEITLSYLTSGRYLHTYSGPHGIIGTSIAPPLPLVPRSAGEMDSLGTSAIAKVIPTSPVAGLGQFLGELRQLPTLPGLALMRRRARKMSLARASSSEYLNIMFGWIPFVNELIRVADTVSKADAIVAQYERDSGRLVRRRITMINQSSSVVTKFGNTYGAPGLDFDFYRSPGILTKTVTTTQRVWFSGAFTYYLSSGKTPAKQGKSSSRVSFYEAPRESKEELAKRRRQILSKLYGLRADPHLFYQLYPWSWLADWFTNMGSVSKNFSAFANDGLVMRYGYVMSYTRETTMYSAEGLTYRGGGSPGVDVLVSHCKQRSRGTPFGFGLNPDTFSARQMSILGALSLQKFSK